MIRRGLQGTKPLNREEFPDAMMPRKKRNRNKSEMHQKHSEDGWVGVCGGLAREQRKRKPTKKAAARQRPRKKKSKNKQGRAGTLVMTSGGATKLLAPHGGEYTSRYVGVGW